MANPYSKHRIRKITRRFGLRPLRSGTVASFYKENAIIQVQTKTGTYAVKPFFRNTLLRSSTLNQMKSTADNIELLINSGFSYMPKWLTTRSGKLWTLHHGRPFYMTEWIKGRNLETTEDYEELGRALATLHMIPSGHLDTKGPSPVNKSNYGKSKIASFVHEWKKLSISMRGTAIGTKNTESTVSALPIKPGLI
ncbi:aminoglycoside phosphotransferase family protein [Paenibacillus alginolyticus]|uniref:hypothetical protein n=1 Tax=Paenibacillus alginolyticus TaxID=59839 RepID=UPI0022846443|nr:hypothetical protein [Paenibacillus alginolyticus]MCY9670031.1 aminoglycoside phosphotransferase family protein [Paenibacillus alginolyticus]